MQKLFKSLTEAIKNHELIVLMAHKNIDLDALGSLLCLYEICESFNKKSYLMINNEVSDSVLKSIKMYDDIYLKNDSKNIRKDSLLIIVDTNKNSLVEFPELLDIIEDVFVIDHHVKDSNYIKNADYLYINPILSSVSEILLSYAKYLNRVLSKKTATIMLAGIEIDTNSYKLKTSASTYEAASDLMKMGASNDLKNELLKENMDEYFERQSLIKSAYMINEVMALCVFDEKTYSKETIAIVATDLLQFENVKAGFAIGKLKNGNIGISAKSLSGIDVEKYMKLLGGGGHNSNAATEIKNVSILEAKDMLLKVIKE